MPSAAYGRGGGGNFVKKPKVPKPLNLSSSNKDSNETPVNSKLSLLKKITLALPNSPGRRTHKSSRSMSQMLRPISSQDTNSWHVWDGTNPEAQRNPPHSSPAPLTFATPTAPSQPVQDSPSNTESDKESNDASSGYDENTLFYNRRRPLSAVDILPFSSPQIVTDTESTIVPDQLSPILRDSFPSEDFSTPLTRTSRPRSLSAGSLSAPRRIHFEGPGGGPRANKKVPLISESKPTFTNRTPLTKADSRGRRIVLGPVPGNHPSPARRPFTHTRKGSVSSKTRDYVQASLHDMAERKEATLPTPRAADSFSSLFAGCAVSLFLLMVLAAGKDALYILALMPVLVAVIKCFVDLNKPGVYTPMFRNSLESLLSL